MVDKQTRVILLLLHFLVDAQFSESNPASRIKFVNNGYTDITIVIDETFDEDRKLLRRLQGCFTSASEVLFKATSRRAYFKQITIIVPEHWNQTNVTSVIPKRRRILEEADVRVVNGNPLVLQSGICGSGGVYIQLTPAFIMNDQIQHPYTGRIVVKLWAGYRYGVYEERPNPLYPTLYPVFYRKDDKMFPTGCTDHLKGWKIGICPLTKLQSCKFLSDMNNPLMKASLMSYFEVQTVENFCDNITEGRKHNFEAPTEQNRRCSYRSVGEVIESHADMRMKPLSMYTITEPQFTLKRAIRRPFTYVFLVEFATRSLPMKELLEISLKRTVYDMLPDDSSVGFIFFNMDVLEDFTMNITHLQETTTRANICDQLSTYLKKDRIRPGKSDSNINKAVIKALDLLPDNEVSEDAVFFLITKLDKSDAPLESDIPENLRQLGVVVHNIHLGKEMNENAAALAHLTEGKVYHVDSTHPKDEVLVRSSWQMDRFFASLIEPSEPAHQLHYKEHIEEPFRSTFHIPDLPGHLGKNTVFLMLISLMMPWEKVDMYLEDPQGHKVYNTSRNRNAWEASNLHRFRFDDSQTKAGRWTLVWNPIKTEINHAAKALSTYMDFFVYSEHKNAEEGKLVQAQAWISTQEVDFTNRSGDFKVHIYAQIWKDVNDLKYCPVIRCKAKAIVLQPGYTQYWLRLYDDGIEPDANKDDGLYSGTYTSFESNGSYSVFLDVVNEGEARPDTSKGQKVHFLKGIFIPTNLESSESQNYFPVEEFEFEKESDNSSKSEVESVHNFSLRLEAGQFRVRGWSQDRMKPAPPRRITDVEALNITLDKDNCTEKPQNTCRIIVTLQWTYPAVAESRNDAAERKIEIRGAYQFESLLPIHFEAYGIPLLSVASPSPPERKKQNVVVRMNDTGNENQTICCYFAVRMRERNGAALGEVSNVAPICLPRKKNTTGPAVQVLLHREDKNLFTSKILLLGKWIAGALIVLCLATLSWYLVYNKGLFFCDQKNTEDETEEREKRNRSEERNVESETGKKTNQETSQPESKLGESS